MNFNYKKSDISIAAIPGIAGLKPTLELLKMSHEEGLDISQHHELVPAVTSHGSRVSAGAVIYEVSSDGSPRYSE